MDRIVVRPDIHFGKPCVAGTRIQVKDVLELVEKGLSFEAVIRDHYPDLTLEDVKACVHYALEIVRSEEVHISSTAA